MIIEDIVADVIVNNVLDGAIDKKTIKVALRFFKSRVEKVLEKLGFMDMLMTIGGKIMEIVQILLDIKIFPINGPGT